MNAQELNEHLPYFTGTEGYLRYNPMLFPNVLLTDGAQFLAEEAGAYWLMDAIASHLPSVPKDEHFVVVSLDRVGKGSGARLTLSDDNPPSRIYARQDIEYTDFPLDEIVMYASFDGEHWVILLRSEY